jgi:hypothetical protein
MLTFCSEGSVRTAYAGHYLAGVPSAFEPLPL